MTENQNTRAMGRKQNARRNKSTTSTGSKKNRAASTSSAVKFVPNIDGYNTFLLAVTRLGKHGNEFTWHDIRKVYHKETQRNLTVEEINLIFSTKNLTKREIFDLPCVSAFLKSMDGSMMCRFMLKQEAMETMNIRSLENEEMCQESRHYSDSDMSPPQSKIEEEPSKCIAISTDCESKIGPISDLSKSEVSDDLSTRNEVLSHQNSLQSSVTDDEGWASGRETRSDNSSPPLSDTAAEKAVGDDEVFVANQERIAAGSDEVDGLAVSTMMVVDDKDDQDVYLPSSPIVITSSVEAAFEALVHSTEDTSIVADKSIINVSEKANVHVTPAKEKKESDNAPIRKLIEKFDTPVKFSEVRQSPNKSIYAQVLEEIGGKNEDEGSEKVINENADARDSVVFRSAPVHATIIENEKEELAKFVAEQNEKVEKKPAADSESAFAVKEQASITSLDREYFESKMCIGQDLFEELNIKEVDGCIPKEGNAAVKSGSEESALESEGLVTVIERNQRDNKSDKSSEAIRDRANSIESDDVPYSLCSEDEGEPMTLIEKSMSPQVHKVEKTKTEIVNVEIDAKSKREATIDVSTSLKQRIAALEAASAGLPAPVPKTEGVKREESEIAEDGVYVLSRSVEFEGCPLEVDTVAIPPTRRGNAARVAGRRQARFIRGCCVVM